MKLKYRKYFVILLAAALFLLVAALGFRELASNIANERSCRWANIDNIEIHTKINIPAITKAQCQFRESDKLKTSFFKIDTSEVSLSGYIAQNAFLPLSAAPDSLRRSFNTDTLEGKLYYRAGVTRKSRWKALPNEKDGSLRVVIDFD